MTLHIHDGATWRPLDTERDLGYDPGDLLAAAAEDAPVLYEAEAQLLGRIARWLGHEPRRRRVFELSVDDAMVAGHALETLGRLRARRLEALERDIAATG